MGPTYLVLLVSGSAAIILYRGHDEAEARATMGAGIKEHGGKGALDAHIFLSTVRAEARLS